jgi:hypothetical protein
MGRTECHWVYGVKPLVLHRARPLKGLTTASGSTAAAAPGPDRGSRQLLLVLQPQLRQAPKRADKRPLVLQPQLRQAPDGAH